MKRRGDIAFWAIQIPGWLLFLYLFVAQGLAGFSYDLGVRMGSQEPPEQITEVGAAFWYGFALGDLLTYIPLLAAGLVGYWVGRRWGTIVLAAAAGITIYWPVVCLVAMVDARDAVGWTIASETPYWVVCLAVCGWGLAALGTLLKPGPGSRGT